MAAVTSRTAALTIDLATRQDIKPALEILMDSYLGEAYFTHETAEAVLKDSLKVKQLYIAKDRKAEVIAFYRFSLDGTFGVFPYLHLLAVKKELRGTGIGSRLLKDIEKRVLADTAYPFAKKIFLLLGKSNRKGKGFYAKNGYVRVGTLPSLFSAGADEYLMMKDLGS